MSYAVLIADDEQHARDYLVSLIEKDDRLTIIGQCKSGNEVIAFCKTLIPDVILLDIQMPGLNGLETARRLMEGADKPVIIFTTAFDQYAIEAFEVEALSYLLKPFSEADFNTGMKRALTELEKRDKLQFSERIDSLLKRFSQPPKVYLEELKVRVKGLEKTIRVDDMVYLKSDSEYVEIHCLRTKYLQRTALKTLEQQLPDEFKRIHRSIILNRSMVLNWKYLHNNTFSFEMKNGVILTSSRTYKVSIEHWLHMANP